MPPSRPKRPPSPAEIAATVLRDKGLGRAFPIDLEAVLRDEVVELEYFEAERDLEGRLELVSGVPAIFVNIRGKDAQHPRVRFTLGHEIGHFFLHRKRLRTKGPFRDDRIVLDQGARVDDTEREANEFAIGLLLPDVLLKERFDRTRLIDIDFIAKLGADANVSLQATAIRVVRETKDRICVLLVRQGKIGWVVASDDWIAAKLPAGQLKGKALPEDSVAARRANDFREERVPIKIWAAKQGWRDLSLYESAIDGPHGRLVFLGAGEADDESEGNESNTHDDED